MAKLYGPFMAAAAVLFFSGAAAAGEEVLLALNTPVKPAITASGLAGAATGQLKIDGIQPTDFDVLSAINDPLYREGARELLKEASKKDAAEGEKPAVKAAGLKDAPISKQAPAAGGRDFPALRQVIKKPKAKKPPHADPLKTKNTL